MNTVKLKETEFPGSVEIVETRNCQSVSPIEGHLWLGFVQIVLIHLRQSASAPVVK